jgi:anti-sigma factor RsiW
MQSNPVISSLDGERRRIMKILKTISSMSLYNKSEKGNISKCKQIRNRLYSVLGNHLSPDAPWMRKHIAQCPRCQKRFNSISKVNLTMSCMKSQPHSLDLLKRANIQTIGVLKHSLREVPKAQKLRRMFPEPKLFERMAKYFQPSANLAVCVFILVLMKMSVFSSMSRVQTQGQKAMKQYYVAQVGEDLAEDIFPGDIA